MRDDREIQEKKALYRGLEKHVGLGGFIAEQIELDAYELFSDDVIEAVDKHITYGPGFWEVADATYDVSDSISECCAFSHHDKDFEDWTLDNVARLEAERYRSGKGYYWMNLNAPIMIKRKLSRLNALEEKILFLSLGLCGDEEMTKEEIALLPEFECPVEYVERILGGIDESLMGFKNYLEEYDRDFEKVEKDHMD